MNHFLSYFGLVDAKIRVSDKDLPVQASVNLTWQLILKLKDCPVRFKTVCYKSENQCLQNGMVG